ncbi:MAG: DUF6599 family protein [bacterium]
MAALIFGCLQVALAKPSAEDLAKLLPNELGTFRLRGKVRLNPHPNSAFSLDLRGPNAPVALPGFAGAEADYVSAQGGKLLIALVRVERDSDAYSFLTTFAQGLRDAGHANDPRIGKEVGTASVSDANRVTFFKGPIFVTITDLGTSTNSEKLLMLARLLADRLESGEGDLPVLVKHVPNWERVQDTAVYLAGFRSLKGAVSNQAILEAVTSEGDGDAVVTNQGNSQFVLVEFNTPQLAGDNDRAIIAKIQELRSQNQPVPSAYRRVGNYSVFVFNAPSEQAANELIDQVRYEQMVQWLGDNPYRLEKMQREYYRTTAGVFLSVVKASGLSAIFCLAVGGLFGAILFTRRRSQQQTTDAFSDAGGMLRLNLDELTPQGDPSKLIGPGQ